MCIRDRRSQLETKTTYRMVFGDISLKTWITQRMKFLSTLVLQWHRFHEKNRHLQVELVLTSFLFPKFSSRGKPVDQIWVMHNLSLWVIVIVLSRRSQLENKTTYRMVFGDISLKTWST